MSYSEREPSILLCEERMFDRVAKNKFKGFVVGFRGGTFPQKVPPRFILC